MAAEAPDLVTIPELAKEYKISTNFLYQRSRRNQLPGAVRIGRYLRVDRREFFAAARSGELSTITD